MVVINTVRLRPDFVSMMNPKLSSAVCLKPFAEYHFLIVRRLMFGMGSFYVYLIVAFSVISAAWLELNSGGSWIKILRTTGCRLNSLAKNCLTDPRSHPLG